MPNTPQSQGKEIGDKFATDSGYTLLELMFVVVILGIITTVAVLSVGGIVTEAAGTACESDARQLAVSIEAYFAQNDSDTVPVVGTDDDRYEQGLVSAGFIRSVSELHNIDANGEITVQAGSSC
jgi:prepilin-type N-terminal cleavage/methylation domain-containing protein